MKPKSNRTIPATATIEQLRQLGRDAVNETLPTLRSLRDDESVPASVRRDAARLLRRVERARLAQDRRLH